MSRISRIAVTTAVFAAVASAQWLSYPTAGLPRTKDGKPNLTAPMPKTASGKPDLSGVWLSDTGKYYRDLAMDLGPEGAPMLEWAKKYSKERTKSSAIRLRMAATSAWKSPDPGRREQQCPLSCRNCGTVPAPPSRAARPRRRLDPAAAWRRPPHGRRICLRCGRFYRRQGHKIGLLWIDAHSDINTPDTLPSGNVHGMPLAALLGLGPDPLSCIYGYSPEIAPETPSSSACATSTLPTPDIPSPAWPASSPCATSTSAACAPSWKRPCASPERTTGYHVSLDMGPRFTTLSAPVRLARRAGARNLS